MGWQGRGMQKYLDLLAWFVYSLGGFVLSHVVDATIDTECVMVVVDAMFYGLCAIAVLQSLRLGFMAVRYMSLRTRWFTNRFPRLAGYLAETRLDRKETRRLFAVELVFYIDRLLERVERPNLYPPGDNAWEMACQLDIRLSKPGAYSLICRVLGSTDTFSKFSRSELAPIPFSDEDAEDKDRPDQEQVLLSALRFIMDAFPPARTGYLLPTADTEVEQNAAIQLYYERVDQAVRVLRALRWHLAASCGLPLTEPCRVVSLAVEFVRR